MLNQPTEITFDKITAKNLPTEGQVTSGHRACQGCVEILAMNMVTKAAGSNTIAINATGCMEIVTSPFPHSAWSIPWIHVAFENAAAVASGVEAGLNVLLRKKRFRGKKPNIITFAGDGATADIGLQSLSGMLERGHKVLYVCLDNEAYMNTGVQRSSSTPFGATTTTSPAGKASKGQRTWKKNVAAIAAAHNIPYVATASPAFHLDLMNKVRKALAAPGPAYIQIFSPCPTGWGSAPEKGIELARLAAQTGIFPLYEVVFGHYSLTHKAKELKPVEEYFKLQRRFRHLTPADMTEIGERVKMNYDRLKALENIEK